MQDGSAGLLVFVIWLFKVVFVVYLKKDILLKLIATWSENKVVNPVENLFLSLTLKGFGLSIDCYLWW